MTRVPIYWNQYKDLQSKSMDWFLYHRDLPYEWVKQVINYYMILTIVRPFDGKTFISNLYLKNFYNSSRILYSLLE